MRLLQKSPTRDTPLGHPAGKLIRAEIQAFAT